MVTGPNHVDTVSIFSLTDHRWDRENLHIVVLMALDVFIADFKHEGFSTW